MDHITKTCLYNFDPLKHHFYIAKLGFAGVYIIFLISAQKHRLWVLVRTASPRRFKRVPTVYVLSRNMKNIRIFYLKIFSFWRWNFLHKLNRRVFVMSPRSNSQNGNTKNNQHQNQRLRTVRSKILFCGQNTKSTISYCCSNTKSTECYVKN